MKILLMFFNERCYTYTLKEGYFIPYSVSGHKSYPLNRLKKMFFRIKDSDVGLLYFEERYLPFVEKAENFFKKTKRLKFPLSARGVMNLPIEENRTRKKRSLPNFGSSGEYCASSGSGSGSGSSSGGNFIGYGLDLI